MVQASSLVNSAPVVELGWSVKLKLIDVTYITAIRDSENFRSSWIIIRRCYNDLITNVSAGNRLRQCNDRSFIWIIRRSKHQSLVKLIFEFLIYIDVLHSEIFEGLIVYVRTPESFVQVKVSVSNLA